MGIFESYTRRAKEAAAEETAKTPKAPPEQTMSDILNNSESEMLFRKMLVQEGPAGEVIAQKLANPEGVDANDLIEIEQWRKKFTEKMTAVRELKNEVTLDTIKEFVAGNVQFEDLLNLVGPQKMVEFIHKHMPHVAVDDPDRFNGIKGQLDQLKNRRESSAKAFDGRIKQLMEQNGIEIDESLYARILQNPDPKAREKEMRDAVGTALGAFRTVLNGMTFGFIAHGITKELTQPRADMESAMSLISSEKQTLGNLLGSTISDNDDVRLALMRTILSEKVEKKGEPEPTLKDMRKSAPSEDDIKKAWKEKIGRIADYETRSDIEKTAIEDEFWGEQRAVFEKKTGFWAKIFAALFDAAFRKKINLNG